MYKLGIGNETILIKKETPLGQHNIDFNDNVYFYSALGRRPIRSTHFFIFVDLMGRRPVARPLDRRAIKSTFVDLIGRQSNGTSI